MPIAATFELRGHSPDSLLNIIRAEQPSRTTPFHVDAVSSSEAASLHGQKAKTPVIAGSICGAVLGLAWLIALYIWIRKRYKRRMRKRAAMEAGEEPEPTKQKTPDPSEKIIIPPDPAVLMGRGLPGEYVTPDHPRRHSSKDIHPPIHSSASEPAVGEHSHAAGDDPGVQPKPPSPDHLTHAKTIPQDP